ncbi:hypothetical protein KY290_004983 [Solanum tuberosum]|uniref:Uncharacterized protein n=1 Tax=Solanum tuberosum TaxID=4113 RepID=A0ABQ7WCT3_SOLTU|nr:hypothetical protein KY289_005345 [Solanum tuberosum]KAH0778556.1 hypothetical protein KY290_004983 [Solanum tuberosum]
MSNPSSPPKSPLSQEIKNPSSFDFSIPPSESSPFTPVCGVGETGESVTPHTEVLVSCAESYPEAGSQPGHVSSTMSERLFEGDLPEGKGIKSNILAAAEELVVVQSLASLRGYTQISLLEEECRLPEQVPHSVNPMFDQTHETMGVDNEEEEEEVPLVWSRKRVRGANASNMHISNLEHTDVAPEEKFEKEPTESKKKRKGKMLGCAIRIISRDDEIIHIYKNDYKGISRVVKCKQGIVYI